MEITNLTKPLDISFRAPAFWRLLVPLEQCCRKANKTTLFDGTDELFQFVVMSFISNSRWYGPSSDFCDLETEDIHRLIKKVIDCYRYYPELKNDIDSVVLAVPEYTEKKQARIAEFLALSDSFYEIAHSQSLQTLVQHIEIFKIDENYQGAKLSFVN